MALHITHWLYGNTMHTWITCCVLGLRLTSVISNQGWWTVIGKSEKNRSLYGVYHSVKNAVYILQHCILLVPLLIMFINATNFRLHIPVFHSTSCASIYHALDVSSQVVFQCRRLYPDISFFQLPTAYPCRDYKGAYFMVFVIHFMMSTNRNCNRDACTKGKGWADNLAITSSGVYTTRN